MTEDDLKALAPWLERRHETRARLDPQPARALAATLDLPHPQDWNEGSALPPLWHQLYLLDLTPSAALGEDGSPTQDGGADGLMPPVPLPQLMWAGADYRYHAPLVLGEVAQRHARIADMRFRTGRRGAMVFVTWERTWSQHGSVALVEQYRGVFLGPARPEGAVPAAAAPVAARELCWPSDEARLFRFSALTFNTHRIHYDLAYARDVAGYPALVVHGPLQACLIAETWRRWHPERRLESIRFVARAPLFLGRLGHAGVRVRAAAPDAEGTTRLWTCGEDGQPCIEAQLQAAP